MKNERFLELMNEIDDDLLARAERTSKAKIRNGLWLKWSTVAACACLIIAISASIIIPLISPDDTEKTATSKISTMASGNKISGKQELIIGDNSIFDGGVESMIAPGFYIRTVIEAQVIEVLPDVYSYPDNGSSYHIVKLRVVDKICGEGLPDEVFLRYPYYDTHIFDGYDSFILALRQVGVENFMMINDTQKRVEYFSDMFEVYGADLGYGSVIAFRDGKVDDSFWDKADYILPYLPSDTNWIEVWFTSHKFPAARNSTLEQVKANIEALAKEQKEEQIFLIDYITAEEIFLSDEAKEIKDYVVPSTSNVFKQLLYRYQDRFIIEYTRVINGFLTDEIITVNGDGDGTVTITKKGESYTASELACVPNLGEALEKMNLSQITPPYEKLTVDMKFQSCQARGFYRKRDGKMYGVIRILWYYKHPTISHALAIDDLYYLYDQSGNGKTMSREELKDVIGEDSAILPSHFDAFYVDKIPNT